MEVKKYILLVLLLGIIAIASAQNFYKFKPHPEASKRGHDEVAPVLTSKGMIFTSNLIRSSVKRFTDLEGRPYWDIYFCEIDEEGNWKESYLLSANITTPQTEGPASINKDEDLIVFSRSFEVSNFGNKRSGNPYTGIYFSEKEGGEWTNITEFEFNDREAHNSFPALSPDGESLFFSSNREGGFGGFDIYVSRKENGNWTKPVNIGPRVNTSENEIYPFIHSSGRLYFSSNGHDNIGGFDIFYSEYFNDRWFQPVKLPSPFNSGLNDFTFYIDDDFEKGLFSSARRGSIDIFTFESMLPTFDFCKKQVENNYCYIFYEENTVELDTSVYLYEWDLGDGNKKRSLEVEHCFEGPGDYLIRLNVVDRLTDIVEFNQAEYMVEVRKVIQPYITAPDTVWAGEEIQIHGLESYFGDVQAGEFYWDFGDGGKAVGASVRHVFQSPGQYQIRLGVIEDVENTETAIRFCSYKPIVVIEE